MKKILALFVVAAIVLFAGYEILIYYDNNFRYGRMRETPGVKPHEEPLLIMAKGVVPVSGGEAVLLATDANALQPAVDMSAPETIGRGKSVYFTFCAQCHGNNFDGQGTVGQSFQPLPTNLSSGKVQTKTVGELFKSVSYGVKDGRQPALHTTIAIEDRWRVVAFVKSLGTRQ
jgi:mono/diheme cytochrome c family protein